AFQVTADVPEIYMQEFWATAKLHHNSIRFKIDTKKSVLDLEAFREMLHISPRIPNQSFAELPSEEESLDFLRFLGHSHEIRYLTDVNVALDEALVPSAQRLRIGRSNFLLPSDIQSKEPTLQVVYDVLRNSPFFKAFLVTADVPEIYMQEFWATTKLHQHSICFKMDSRKHGLYHRSNVDYAYLIWEDFVYQVEHKNQKKSNEMYYPRFTKVIIDYFMTRKPSIPRRNRVNWHYVRDDVLFSTIKVVSRHQTTQQYGVILPIELTIDDIRNSKAYKEYYACATGEVAPKPKASARKKKGGSASSTTPPTPIATLTPTTTVVAAPRLSAAAKGKQPARATTPTEPTDIERTEAKQLKIGSCRSLVELKFFLEEVYKATTDQLEWVNPEGQQYTHNLLKPLSLIPNNRGHRVIPFDHFINNDLEYLCEGADDQPIIQTTQHPKWFSQPRKPPTPDRDWNKSVPAAQGEA
nr:hypothetical protein [Tanacetum cinerariifolium]